jgi:hypothetical protein
MVLAFVLVFIFLFFFVFCRKDKRMGRQEHKGASPAHAQDV